ncbi:MAG: hypothetical protein UZ14_CFX002001312 [Chloroflexi bacterium OLB14]|nr:MAG: hypothetical protein UZ14_CFX002001312 [Chloroflexi bacterium OLB14]
MAFNPEGVSLFCDFYFIPTGFVSYTLFSIILPSLRDFFYSTVAEVKIKFQSAEPTVRKNEAGEFVKMYVTRYNQIISNLNTKDTKYTKGIFKRFFLCDHCVLCVKKILKEKYHGF